MGRVVHFEIGADDPLRCIRFYQEAFGWDIQKWEGPLEYWLVMTGPEKEPGIDGAIMKRNPLKELFPTTKLKNASDSSMKRFIPKGYGATNTVGVDNIEEAIEKIKKAGGKQSTPVEFIPGVGHFCYCSDTEDNSFGLMQWAPGTP